jgi:hypothetical protein
MQLEIGECFENINDALHAAVNALGGYKKVGPGCVPSCRSSRPPAGCATA